MQLLELIRGPKIRLSENASNIIQQAKQEARRLNHHYVGTEHLLLSLVKDPTTKKVFDRFLGSHFSNVSDASRITSAVEFIVDREEEDKFPQEIGMLITSSQAKKAIELAFKEARQGGRQEVVEVDLMVGLIREGKGVAAGILQSFMLDKTQISNLQHLYKSMGTEPN